MRFWIVFVLWIISIPLRMLLAGFFLDDGWNFIGYAHETRHSFWGFRFYVLYIVVELVVLWGGTSIILRRTKSLNDATFALVALATLVGLHIYSMGIKIG